MFATVNKKLETGGALHAHDPARTIHMWPRWRDLNQSDHQAIKHEQRKRDVERRLQER
jgi:hypothetical protein